MTKWPSLISRQGDWPLYEGVSTYLLVAMGVLDLIGLRHPAKTLATLVFESIWKIGCLTADALPLWAQHQLDPVTTEVRNACLLGVVVVAVAPWRVRQNPRRTQRRRGQLELTRAPNDHRLYSLAGIGTIRREGGMFSNTYIADAAEHSWRFTSRGIMQHKFEATARDGTIIGTFLTKAIRRGGQLDWGTEQLALKPASLGRERYVLSNNSRDIILFEGKSWGRHPVMVTMLNPGVTDSGLVLFAAFVVHRLAINASSMAGSVAAATASSSSS